MVKEYKQKLLQLVADPEFFKTNRVEENKQRFEQQHPNRLINVFERISVDDDGIHVHFKGLAYPRHGFPFHEALDALYLVKKYTMNIVATLGQKELKWAFLGFALTSWKNKIKVITIALEKYNAFGDRALNHVLFSDRLTGTIILKRKYCMKFSRETIDFVSRFLDNLGINAENQVASIRDDFAEIIGMIFEYDDSYRYMARDIMSETSRHDLYIAPRREIKRLARIFMKRAKYGEAFNQKVTSFINITTMALLHPRIKKAFQEAVLDSDFYSFQYDKADEHHVLQRNGYDFHGMSDEERNQIYLDFYGDNLPEVIKVP